MPICINLLAEAQAAEEMRRKDPVKRAVWIGGLVILVMIFWAATLQTKIIVARSEVKALEASWKNIEKRVAEVNEHRSSTRELEAKLSALDQFTTNRTLWAPALNALQYTPVEGVQLVRVHTEQAFLQGEGTKPRTLEGGTVIPGKPGPMTERIVVTIEGRDFSARPGEQVPKFKQQIVSYPYFESILQRTNKIQLTSQTAPQSDLGRAYVGFGLKLFFGDKEHHLYE